CRTPDEGSAPVGPRAAPSGNFEAVGVRAFMAIRGAIGTKTAHRPSRPGCARAATRQLQHASPALGGRATEDDGVRGTAMAACATARGAAIAAHAARTPGAQACVGARTPGASHRPGAARSPVAAAAAVAPAAGDQLDVLE